MQLKLVTNNEIETGKEQMPELKLLEGGKNPPNGNWLSELDTGTMFLVQDKTNHDFLLGAFKLVNKTEKAVMLVNSSVPNPVFVNPMRFCNKYSLYEVLGIHKEPEQQQEQETEVTDEQGNRNEGDSTGTDEQLEGDASVQSPRDVQELDE